MVFVRFLFWGHRTNVEAAGGSNVPGTLMAQHWPIDEVFLSFSLWLVAGLKF